MNEILKNTHVFVDVLCMSRCDAVRQWDEGAFQKAYKWANYFEEVYHRLKSRPSLAEKLDKYLENFNKSEQIYLGKFKLSVEVLGKSKTLLRQFLLQNPHLSDSQYKLTLKLYGMTIGETQTCGNNEELLRDFCHLSQTRAALYLLCKMRDRLTEDIRISQEKTVKTSLESSTSNVGEFPSAVSSGEVAVDVTAQCLFKYVQHQVKVGDPQRRRKLLFGKLHVLAEQGNGLRSIITSLLLTSDDCQSGQQANDVMQFLLEWLLEFLSKASTPHPSLMSIPPHLLRRVAFMYDAFFKIYLSHLQSWAENMVPKVCCSRDDCHTSRGILWRFKLHETSQNRQGKDDGHLTFTNLVNHLRHLATGGDFVADATKKQLQSCLVLGESKVSSIDNTKTFHSLNLNIWEDICSLVYI
ncbi:unnamed protein product [Porites evermanni]|uniref:Uncharacterized protein n=1 Tax=Porites evermanni TaxID=104178 RepID=A0ABN8LWP4_9CNID|nr:unnamed protein product [Porites evermanni]